MADCWHFVQRWAPDWLVRHVGRDGACNHENFANPVGPFIYGMSTMHCMTVSLAYDGEGLGAAWGEQLALEYMAEAGFVDVTVNALAHDPMNNYFLAHKH